MWLVLQTNPKVFVEFANSDALAISNHANKTLSHITNVVVIMQKFDVALDGLPGVRIFQSAGGFFETCLCAGNLCFKGCDSSVD